MNIHKTGEVYRISSNNLGIVCSVCCQRPLCNNLITNLKNSSINNKTKKKTNPTRLCIVLILTEFVLLCEYDSKFR